MSQTVFQTASTGEYLRTITLDDSDRDPLDREVFLIPGGCATEPPPEVAAGEVAVLRNGAWEVAEDHRGTTVYLDGVETTVTEIGPLPEGASLELPPQNEADLFATLRAARDARLSASDVYVWPDRWDGYTAAERAAWTEYRQALRDLPAITSDPANPEWPEVPAETTTEGSSE